jgi:hypothetical protein
LVNMTGGFFWDVMARGPSFRRYLKTGRQSVLSHAWFLATFGIGGAMVMSVPGTWVQAALGEQAVFALNPEVAAALARMVAQWEEAVGGYLQTYVGLTWGGTGRLGRWLIGFKTVSVISPIRPSVPPSRSWYSSTATRCSSGN